MVCVFAVGYCCCSFYDYLCLLKCCLFFCLYTLNYVVWMCVFCVCLSLFIAFVLFMWLVVSTMVCVCFLLVIDVVIVVIVSRIFVIRIAIDIYIYVSICSVSAHVSQCHGSLFVCKAKYSNINSIDSRKRIL